MLKARSIVQDKKVLIYGMYFCIGPIESASNLGTDQLFWNKPVKPNAEEVSEWSAEKVVQSGRIGPNCDSKKMTVAAQSAPCGHYPVA